MADTLPIRIKIADRSYGFTTNPDDEEYLRKAGKLIQERIEEFRAMGYRDTQDMLARVAIDCMVARLKGDEQGERLQRTIFDKLITLDQTVGAVLE
jgi:cell division protein ZapA